MAKFLLTIALPLTLVALASAQCPLNQHYENAGPECPDYCGKPEQITCEGTKPGCYCDPGYIFDSNFENCIPVSQCEPHCGDHQHYTECGTMCPRYCGSPDDICIPPGCNRGCYCDLGYVFETKALGICIPEHDCP